ncbi:MAG: YabP/YqfC family sporulation protein [Clostridia bacterium]|nr:YabP/YqfC family sporulation protein [Clostridia bacterium]
MKSEIFGLPADSVLGIPSIRVVGDAAIEVMNYGGLRSCSPVEIVLNTKIGELVVSGEALGISEINSDGIKIEGKIYKIIYG